jgi:hypothetical protein
MKVLLVGEYSRLHNFAQEKLELGHEVSIVGHKMSFKITQLILSGL